MLSVACAVACGPTAPSTADHTVPRIETEAQFDALSRRTGRIPVVKLLLTDFASPTRRDVRLYDTNFYALHDEWYWFRLLNGMRVPGDEAIEPLRGISFATVQDVYAWARMQVGLPFDLQIADGRLYSWRFYERAFGAGRSFGLASLMKLSPRTADEGTRWAFELEFGDALSHEELSVFFESLTPRVAPTIGRDLKWLVRSPEQEALATRMERDRLPYHDRILRYRDVVVPGAREVYSDGITAGYLRFVRASEGVPNSNPNEVLVFEAIPDLLPAAAGVLTAVPQTPLAHINLLARNRGIPNAHLAGALEDPALSQIARGYSPAVFLAQSPDTVQVLPITAAQYDRYVALSERPVRAVSSPAPDTLPYLIDLGARRPDEIPALASAIGGKSMGFIALLAQGSLALPERPHAITVRAYLEHLAPLRARIAAVLADPDFERDARTRELVLDGAMKFATRHPTPADRAFVDAFSRAHPGGNALGDLARGAGVRGLVEQTPIAPGTLEAVRRELSTVFAHLAPTQGLRFRSSSNVEDIEGFNGAGLYESFTGFLDPAAQSSASDRGKTVERAIARVWGSFWGYEAFEERRRERIDSLSAAMGVLVHPRFDDALERATGVCTLTILPPNDRDAVRLEVNVQRGAESVANPDPTILPEVVRVSRARADGALRIERVRRSSLSPAEDLLSDPALRALFADTLGVTERWLARENAPRPTAQHGRGLTLDFEFHDMLAGWPARRDGRTEPARLVLKQARTLEPGPRTMSPEAARWPLPRDVFVRVRRVFRERCALVAGGTTVTSELLRAQTDRSLAPDVGFSETAFDGALRIETSGEPLAALGWSAGQAYGDEHSGLATERTGAGLTVTVREGSPARAGWDRFTLSASGEMTVARGDARVSGIATCRTEALYASPRDYLLGLLGRGEP
jgi:hypothetical protein